MVLPLNLQQLEKMQDEGQIVEKPFERKPLKFRFPELERSGKTVVEIKNLGFRYDDKVTLPSTESNYDLVYLVGALECTLFYFC